MRRNTITPRNQWQKAVEKIGFGFHTTNVPYWKESAYYSFSMEQVLFIENATAELWDMSLEAVQYVIENKLYHKFGIPEHMIPLIEKSWNEDHPAIYGRFDFGYDGTNLKMFEFNADTPTSLFEAGVVQWYWLQDFNQSKDQFNSVHEKLVDYWRTLKNYLYPGDLHFACVRNSLEDLTTVEYMRDCAIQAGLSTKLMFMDEIGWDEEQVAFVDMNNIKIKNIFKLYPWEWMARESFGDKLPEQQQMFWIEPPWKMILSNKAILPIFWKLFPRCPYVLEAYFPEDNVLTNYVKKPILSREGANIEIIKQGAVIERTQGEYGEEGYICQQLFEIPKHDGFTPILGSWVIGQQPAGMGIRESETLITGNTSCFVSHLIDDTDVADK